MQAGIVTEFDEGKGLGAIATADGAMHPFHCAEIADGTRSIDVGQRVRFVELARFGGYQAGAVEKTG